MTDRRAIIVAAAGVGLFVALLVITVQFRIASGQIPGDTLAYLAAGERLNAGHDLYSLTSGDRTIGLAPPYWDVPILSPPLMGVVFRPLAALPSDIGALFWLGALALVVLGAVAAVLRLRPLAAGIALAALGLPLAVQVSEGNVNGLILAGSMFVWRLSTLRRDGWAGVIAGLFTMLKLTPALLLVWVVVRGGRLGLLGAIGGLTAGLAIGVGGSSLEAHTRYAEVAAATTSVGSPLNVGSAAQALGLTESVTWAVAPILFGVAIFAVLALRRRPGVAFAVAVVGSVLGSPVLHLGTPALLWAALAPLAWPNRGSAEGPARAAPVGNVGTVKSSG